MHRKGQIWKNRRNKPDSVFVILRLYERKYNNGDTAQRAKGYIISGYEDHVVSPFLRDLDCRSVERMFPHLLFNPPEEPEETPQ